MSGRLCRSGASNWRSPQSLRCGGSMAVSFSKRHRGIVSTHAGDRPLKAMILAAGHGTRLRPLTNRVPKCMTLVGRKPLLEYTIERLRSFGISEIIINLCHLPEAIRG